MDKRLEEALELERIRQRDNIELIASENYVSKDVLKLQGSILTNKYAEGYPGKDIMVDVNMSIYLKILQENMHANYLIVSLLMFNLIVVVVQIWLYIVHY